MAEYATQVLIAGPSALTVGENSASYTLSLNGEGIDVYIVTVEVGGVRLDNPPDPQVQQRAGIFFLQASNDFKANFSIRVSMPGYGYLALSIRTMLNPTVVPWADLFHFTSTPVAPPIPAFDSLWLARVNPAVAMNGSQGTIPAGVTAKGARAVTRQGKDGKPITINQIAVTNKAGQPNLAGVEVETCREEVLLAEMRAGDARFVAAAFRNGYTVARDAHKHPTTWPPTFGAQNNYEMIQRVADPARPAEWAYLHRIHETNIAWWDHVVPKAELAAQPYLKKVQVTDSYRSEVAMFGNDRFSPWGTEEWLITAVRLPANWRQFTGDGWSLHWQMHDTGGGAGPTSGGLTDSPPFACYFTAGGAQPGNSFWRPTLKRYKYTPAQYAANAGIRSHLKIYPTGHTLPTAEWKNPDGTLKASDKYRNGYFPGGNNAIGGVSTNVPVVGDRWYWWLVNYVYGCGPFVDPTTGNKIYGPGDPNQVFFKVWVAEDTGVTATNGPRLVLNHHGFWGSPHTANSLNKLKAGYWKAGPYMKHRFKIGDPAGSERFVYTKGFAQFRARDLPADVDVTQMLAWFRGF